MFTKLKQMKTNHYSKLLQMWYYTANLSGPYIAIWLIGQDNHRRD